MYRKTVAFNFILIGLSTLFLFQACTPQNNEELLGDTQNIAKELYPVSDEALSRLRLPAPGVDTRIL